MHSIRKSTPPRHYWTDVQRIRLLEAIDGSLNYIHAFYPKRGNIPCENERAELDRLSNRSGLERHLCMIILDKTDWMKWMIKDGQIVDGDDGLSWAIKDNEGSENVDNPVRILLDFLDKRIQEFDRDLFQARTMEDEDESYSEECKIREKHHDLCASDWFPIYTNIKSLNHFHWRPRNPPLSEKDTFLSSFEPMGRTSTFVNQAESSESSIAASNLKQRLPITHYNTTSQTRYDHSSSSDLQLQKRPRNLDSNFETQSNESSTKRVKRRAPSIISISSDSEEEEIIQTPDNTIEIDSSDDDEIVITGFKSSARKPFLRPSPSPSSSSSFSATGIGGDDFFIRSYTRTTERVGYLTNFDESDNLDDIRRLSGPIINRNITQNGLSDHSEDESRPSTPPLPIDIHDDEDIRPSWQDTIIPHFMEDMFRDTSIRSYRLDLLHERMGITPIRRSPSPRIMIQSEPLRLYTQEYTDMNDAPRRGKIVYPPLIITDGTLEEYPIPIDDSSPQMNRKFIDINDVEEEEDLVIIGTNDISYDLNNRILPDKHISGSGSVQQSSIVIVEEEDDSWEIVER
ncbi:uncharacterized protein I206_107072 [Kwoniella pini CBS 10737]|uniref:Uncharacterized protein n=1 Tax=Kwoniella pini CBS 10737 TaxID=1296096 RepID=A0A1B9HZB4_9TREE|nr:uncharacterized protein I206_05384 [Kwoniella pini CBS 10737]OCF48604.1 hypothetical protein I206_05384 [Kwoniella pini CBS 10737]